MKNLRLYRKSHPFGFGRSRHTGHRPNRNGQNCGLCLALIVQSKYAQGQHPRALIMAPTRELVMQIEEAVVGFGKYTDLRYVCLYGGLGPKPQIEKLQEGVDIIIATPGRFIDLYHKGEIYTRDIKTMVLDEADKMLDMGFLPQIKTSWK